MLTTSDRTAERAARAILDLINSRPVSPRQEEIEAIIKRVAVESAAPVAANSPPHDPLDEYGPDLTKQTSLT